jgi:hypothetical protein
MNTSTPAVSTGTRVPNKSWHIGLWVAQGLLALAFLMAGAMKTFTPIDQLGQKMPWVTDVPKLVRFIGISELLGEILFYVSTLGHNHSFTKLSSAK